uniref:CUB domain-containing protein n=1 Tax=Rhabditophanes sp. KR3021 TaxID=114890 RepID=A0AC35TVL6_9BILA
MIGYMNQEKYIEYTIEYDTARGSPQTLLGIWPTLKDNTIVTLYIFGSSPIMLTYTTSWAATSNFQDNKCGDDGCEFDYVTFMPVPVIGKACNYNVDFVDQRMITRDFIFLLLL